MNRNEGAHSQLRDRLRRMQRKTRGYTKNLVMIYEDALDEEQMAEWVRQAAALPG